MRYVAYWRIMQNLLNLDELIGAWHGVGYSIYGMGECRVGSGRCNSQTVP